MTADENYAEEFQDPPLSPCTGDWEADWEEAIALNDGADPPIPETVTIDTVLRMYSSDQ
ncbi:hypothetical protein [Synechococcus elongatus]|uniref:Uncharacterized protein n=1 Tax=Synechococcus elongatus PCC 11802 TaxID=2283154 RepID=A0AAT9JTU4_SYNEL|nr:hypothetical protein [Synechococcus elongatus]